MSAENAFLIPSEGQRRVIIRNITTYLSGNEYPVKASVGEPLHFSAILVSDGQDKLFARCCCDMLKFVKK